MAPKNDIEIYLTHIERKSVPARRFVRSWSLLILIVVIMLNTKVKLNDKVRKFKVGNNVRISKCEKKKKKDKGSTPNCSEELFVIKKVKNTVL